MSAVRENPELAAVFHEQFVASRVRLMRELLERAQDARRAAATTSTSTWSRRSHRR